MRALTKNELVQLAGGKIKDPMSKEDVFILGVFMGIGASVVVFRAEPLVMIVGGLLGGILFSNLETPKS